MPLVLAVGVGGAVGAVSRYSLDRFIEHRVESAFPWATFVINVSGCFAVGFIIAAIVDRQRAPQWLKVGLTIGFCGGYTTFSTFAQEALDLIEARDLAIAFASIGASVLLGVLAVLAGMRLGRLV
ncbi:MAG: fluoride efflux transporter CrcB [Gaiellaceae bacterium]